MDMGDPEGARSILDEVMGEGNEEQKREAEDIIAQIG
jgi:pilus assembly protein FimV